MDIGQGYLLIVEDDPDIRALLDTTLRFKKYGVVTAQNGRDALDIIQKKRPTLVIADIMMPHLDGFGLVHRMRINPETRMIPVVFISATYVAPEDRDFALRIGATRFIQKPVDIDKFVGVVEELLKQDPHTIPQPLDEFTFYEGYRKRLESKLEERVRQIAREEHLLGGRSESEDQDIRMSLRHAYREQEELKVLLSEIYKHLERIGGKENNNNNEHEK
jgi:DNA-binding response OmpR family regulator